MNLHQVSLQLKLVMDHFYGELKNKNKKMKKKNKKRKVKKIKSIGIKG